MRSFKETRVQEKTNAEIFLSFSTHLATIRSADVYCRPYTGAFAHTKFYSLHRGQFLNDIQVGYAQQLACCPHK